jgi:hypothetical protein
MRRIKTITAIAAASALTITVSAPATAAVAPTAPAKQCFFNTGPDGDALYASYRDEKVGVMSYVRAGGSMTCASARYVARRLIRQWNRQGKFDRSWFDGYVTWHGRVIGRRSSGAQIIRFRELRSRTSITFDFQVTVF